MRSEAPSEALTVVRQDLVGDAVAVQRRGQHLTDGLGRRPGHDAGGDAEPTVIVDAGHDLELVPVVEFDAAHHVHLPQLHRTVAFPAAELVAALAAAPELDQAVAAQAPVDARATGDWFHALPGELVLDPSGSPARVLAAELADKRLDLGGDLVRASARAMRPVSQRGQAPQFVAAIQACTLWRETPSRAATSVTFQPSCTTASTAWYRCSMTESSSSTAHLLIERGGVKHQPEPPSRISRSRCQGSAGTPSSIR
jgi:hypothetical protein